MSKSIMLALALLTTGCASTPAVRGLAEQTGPFVVSLQKGTADFVEAQNILNEENQARLAHLKDFGAPDRADVRVRRLSWTDAGDTTRLNVFDAATAVSAEDIITVLESKEAAAPTIKASSGEAYGKTLKALADVAAKPKSSTVLRELLEFGQDVNSKYGELTDKAKEAAKGTAAPAEANDLKAKAAADVLKQ